ncbi:hypothetical protein M2169_000561 [Streptomyces sp. MJP52]|nr:hypothetical protein [Streptomyces sp. MJP52]
MKICAKHKGATAGEPSETGSDADGTHCVHSSSEITYAGREAVCPSGPPLPAGRGGPSAFSRPR